MTAIHAKISTKPQYTSKLNFSIYRRVKDDAVAREESDFKVRVEQSLENLREKMERELEDKKLEMLEVRLIHAVVNAV